MSILQNKKKTKMSYTYDLELPEQLVRTYCSPQQLERMVGNYHKRVTLDLLPPPLQDDTCAKPKVWTLRARGQHRQTVKQLGKDMQERYETIIHIIRNVLSTNA